MIPEYPGKFHLNFGCNFIKENEYLGKISLKVIYEKSHPHTQKTIKANIYDVIKYQLTLKVVDLDLD